ncbi:MAG: hypothetical protein E7536_01965 [Ruminococcaceae bacterium]|nr:hypothetical protein [Oscillospiraceae bacterium]
MDRIKQWIITIVLCSVIAAVVNILTPDSNVKKTMKIIVASFLVCAFISPFIQGEKINFKEDLPDFSLYYSSLSLDISETMISETEKTVVKSISDTLKEDQVEYIEINVKAEVNDKNEIYIDSVTITLSDEYKSEENDISGKIQSMFAVETDYIWVKN